MVLSPINSIIDDVLLKIAEQDYQKTGWTKDREKKGKLVVMFRFDLLSSMLRILQKFGSSPPFREQKFVTKLIKSKDFGKDAMIGGANSPLCVTGFTAAFFLTSPELFTQWMQQKDADGSKVPAYQILDFVGKQCLWPTFAKRKSRQTNGSHTVKERGIGSMISNAQSQTPYSFLPFDLEKLFNQCLDGTVLWKTVSLCEETKRTQSPRKKVSEEKHAQPVATENNDIADAEKEEADKISTNEESDESDEENDSAEIQQEEEEEGKEEEEQEEEQAEEDKKPAADPNFQKKPQRKRKRSERVESESSGSKGQEAKAVAQGIAKQVASQEMMPSVLKELVHNDRATNITEDFVRLMLALEMYSQDFFADNPYLKTSIDKASRWKHYHIYSVRSHRGGRGYENDNKGNAQQEEGEEEEVQEQEEQAEVQEQEEQEEVQEQAEVQEQEEQEEVQEEEEEEEEQEEEKKPEEGKGSE